MGLELAIGSGHVNWWRLERKFHGKYELKKNRENTSVLRVLKYLALTTLIWQENSENYLVDKKWGKIREIKSALQYLAVKQFRFDEKKWQKVFG